MGVRPFVLLCQIFDRVRLRTSKLKQLLCLLPVPHDLLHSLYRSDRSDFKSEPAKMKSVLGMMVQIADDPLHPDSFHLADAATGTLNN